MLINTKTYSQHWRVNPYWQTPVPSPSDNWCSTPRFRRFWCSGTRWTHCHVGHQLFIVAVFTTSQRATWKENISVWKIPGMDTNNVKFVFFECLKIFLPISIANEPSETVYARLWNCKSLVGMSCQSDQRAHIDGISNSEVSTLLTGVMGARAWWPAGDGHLLHSTIWLLSSQCRQIIRETLWNLH